MTFLFEFVQFEFTNALGPSAGRYVVENPDGAAGARAAADAGSPDGDTSRRNVTGTTRGVGAADVLVVSVVSAQPSRRRKRHAKPGRLVEHHSEPAEVPLLLVSHVWGTRPLSDETEAQKLLEELGGDEAEQGRRIDKGLQVLNDAIRAYRVAAGDPYLVEANLRDARRVRFGFGATDRVADGEWTAAFELPSPAAGRQGRTESLRPSETVAEVLAGRGRILESEDLLLRVVLDLDTGRTRAAAHGARSAIELLVHEASEAGVDHAALAPERLAEYAGRVEPLADAATRGPLDKASIEELERLVDDVQVATSRWRYESLA